MMSRSVLNFAAAPLVELDDLRDLLVLIKVLLLALFAVASGPDESIYLNPMTLEDGEETVVLGRLTTVLTNRQ